MASGILHVSDAAEASAVVAGHCKVSDIIVTNTGDAGYVLVYDANAVPADAVVANAYAVAIGSGDTVRIQCHGQAFGSGCVIVFSSTAPAKTLGAATCAITVTGRR